jgi:sugar phosphate isomerase/epimerase
MKKQIRSTHVHDNDGKIDGHLFPFFAESGTIDWDEVMPLFRQRGDQFPLLLELKEAAEFPHPIDTIKQVFERLESFA